MLEKFLGPCVFDWSFMPGARGQEYSGSSSFQSLRGSGAITRHREASRNVVLRNWTSDTRSGCLGQVAPPPIIFIRSKTGSHTPTRDPGQFVLNKVNPSPTIANSQDAIPN